MKGLADQLWQGKAHAVAAVPPRRHASGRRHGCERCGGVAEVGGRAGQRAHFSLRVRRVCEVGPCMPRSQG